MLQAFAGQRRSSRRASDEEPTATHVGGGPDQVADPLQSKHRVINKEWNRVDAVIGIRGTGGDERAHRSRLGDAFFQNLSVLRLFVIKERIHIDGLVELANVRIDADLAEERLHAEGARFVGNHGHDKFPNLGIAQQLREHAHEDHGCGTFAALGAFVELFEERFGNRLQRRGAHFSHRHVAAQLFAALLHVLDFRAVIGGAIEGSVVQFAVGNRNAEARAEDLQLIVIQLFLLVRDVLAFARLAESVALDGLGENDGWRSGMVNRSLIGGVHFDGVVAAEAHAGELLVRKMFDHLEQPGIGAKKILPEIGAAFDKIFLILTVRDLAHAPDKQAIAIGLNDRIPIGAPDQFDYVPSRAAENRFQFLDDLAVAAHRSVQPLQVAVDDK